MNMDTPPAVHCDVAYRALLHDYLPENAVVVAYRMYKKILRETITAALDLNRYRPMNIEQFVVWAASYNVFIPIEVMKYTLDLMMDEGVILKTEGYENIGGEWMLVEQYGVYA